MSLAATSMRVRIALLCSLLLLAVSADARMYQWRNPVTGSVQFSGTPPAWYRGESLAGPRIWVFENGNLVDDTAIALPEEQSRELRDAAFEEIEQREKVAAVKKLEQAARREERRKELGTRRKANTTEIVQVDVEESPTQNPQELDQATIDRLKSIINKFDTQ